MLFLDFFKKVINIIGVRFYLLLVIAPIVTILESIGILFFLPILNKDGFSEFLEKIPDFLSSIVYLFYTPGQEGSSGLFVLVFIFFISKGALLFLYQIYLASLRSELGESARQQFSERWYRVNLKTYDKIEGETPSNILTQQVFQMMQVFYQLMNAYSFLMTALINSILCLFVVFEFGIFSVAGFILVYIFLKIIAARIRVASVEYTCETQALSKNLSQDEAALKYLVLSGSASRRENLSRIFFRRLRFLEKKRWVLQAMQNGLREPLALIVIGIAIWTVHTMYGFGFDVILVGCALLYKALNSSLAALANVNSAMEQFGGFQKWESAMSHFDTNVDSVSISTKALSWSEIALTGVAVRYSDFNVFKNLDLVINRHSFIGISGKSGSGKTTLILSILGFSNIVEGKILIDGRVALAEDFISLRNDVGYVSQQTPIFEGTIIANVAMSFTDEKFNAQYVEKVLKEVGLLDYLLSLPDKLDSFISPNSGLLSGGQRQRLLLARELYKSPSLLILDEPTSALDCESEKEMSILFGEVSKICAVILISHSNEPLTHCDTVIKL